MGGKGRGGRGGRGIGRGRIGGGRIGGGRRFGSRNRHYGMRRGGGAAIQCAFQGDVFQLQIDRLLQVQNIVTQNQQARKTPQYIAQYNAMQMQMAQMGWWDFGMQNNLANEANHNNINNMEQLYNANSFNQLKQKAEIKQSNNIGNINPDTRNLHSNQNMGIQMVENPTNLMNSMGMMNLFGLPLPMLNTPSQSTNFSYVGADMNFSSRIQGQSKQEIIAANITLIGNQTQRANSLIFSLTVLFGMCFIFPCFFLCCDWFKKCTWPLYQISTKFYRELQQFVQSCPKMTNISITVVDNYFTRQKAQIIYQIVTQSHFKTFVFQNRAIDIDLNQSEASDFIVNMRPIKTAMPNNSTIFWRQNLVQ